MVGIECRLTDLIRSPDQPKYTEYKRPQRTGDKAFNGHCLCAFCRLEAFHISSPSIHPLIIPSCGLQTAVYILSSSTPGPGPSPAFLVQPGSGAPKMTLFSQFHLLLLFLRA